MNYINKGIDPKLLILSGTHGDEKGLIAPLKRFVENNYEKLPDFIFIPEVSPSAVLKGTRNNLEGLDLNRNFKSDTTSKEAVGVMNYLKNYNFEICLNFHEDPEYSEFYLYDMSTSYLTQKEAYNTQELLNEIVEKTGVKLLNGLDDPSDPDLGVVFVNGYHFFKKDGNETQNDSGFFSTWSLVEKIVKRHLNPEIPGQVSLKIKEEIIKIIFNNLIFQ